MSKRGRSPERRSRSPRERGSSSALSGETITSGPVVLHISGLSRNVTDEYLSEVFGHFGEVKKAVVVTDQRLNLPKGYGFVEFLDLSDAVCALLHLNGGQIDGSSVKVSFVGSDRIPIRSRRDGDSSSSPSPTRSSSPPKLS